MDNKIIEKKAETKEIEDLASIMSQSWKAAFNELIDEESLNQFADENRFEEILQRVHSTGMGNLYIAYMNNKPVREIFWYMDDEKHAEILSVHSLKEVWGTGLGAEMFRQIERDVVSTEGIEEIYLWTFEKNIRACKFYEKMGFVNTNELRESDFEGVNEVRYLKRIS